MFEMKCCQDIRQAVLILPFVFPCDISIIHPHYLTVNKENTTPSLRKSWTRESHIFPSLPLALHTLRIFQPPASKTPQKKGKPPRSPTQSTYLPTSEYKHNACTQKLLRGRTSRAKLLCSAQSLLLLRPSMYLAQVAVLPGAMLLGNSNKLYLCI